MDSIKLKKIDLLDLSLRGHDQASRCEKIKMNAISTSNISKNGYLDICYGFGCSNDSTERIVVKAGNRNICLYLCSICIKKFKPREN